MGVDWNEIFTYEEEVETKLIWKGGYKNNGKVAGHMYKGRYGVVTYKRKPYSIKDIVWEMHNERLGEGELVMYKDDNTKNLSIDNLYKFKGFEGKNLYGKYLEDYLEYGEKSPSGLVWKKSWKKGSRVRRGDIAGSLDKKDRHWRVHSFGRNLKASKIVWALFNDFENQSGKEVDHINGDPSDNRIENLRLISRTKNARNRSISKTSKTGINGVSFSERLGKKGQTLSAYCTVVYVEGRRVARSFSCNKWGEELALLAACEWRDRMITLLNQNGAGYTERHGTNIVGGDIKLESP